MFLVTLFLLALNAKQHRCLLTGKAKKLWQIAGYYSATKKNWTTSVSGNVTNLTIFSLLKETKEKGLYVQPFHVNDYEKDKTRGTKTICRVTREGKEGDWLQRSTKKFYVVPEVFWGQLCSSAYCQRSNTLYCDCTGHKSVCICQNPVRSVVLRVLYKSIAFPGSWLKHCAPLPELQVEGWGDPRRPSFYLSYWQLLAPGIWESSWSLWSNPQRGEERNGAC